VAPEQVAQGSADAAQQADTDSSDIIVTAQRRSERLKDVPIALVARNAEELQQAGATSIRDLTVVTPGLRIQGNGANVQPAIRGVHSDQTDPGNDANVAIYIDGVYQSSQIANNIELADIERVEVLKGPQGTLFGRNATGGAIRVFTREPTATTTGLLDASYGNLDEFQARGFLSGPLAGDTLSASVSGYYLRQDGFTRDIIRGRKIGGLESYSMRGKLLFKPTDRFSIELIGGYVKRHDENATLYQPLDGRSAALAVPGAIVPTRPRQTAVNQPAVTRSRLYTGAIKADLDTDYGTFNSITAYTDVRSFYNTDADFSQLSLLGYPIYARQRDFSEELTFSSEKFGILQATGGLFYFRGRGKYDPLVVEGAFVTPNVYGFFDQNTEAYAAFGEATITPAERLSIILGARYSHEQRTASGSYFVSPTAPDSMPRLGKASFGQFTPRVSVRYTLPSDDNLYATYSRGFKSGGYSISSSATEPFSPEKLDAFEVGLKTSGRRPISANLSAFYYFYSNQ
jgi:iron complex outermembrane receptor protein